MDRPQAIDIMRQVLAQWRGTIADGKLVEEAFVTLAGEPVPPVGTPPQTGEAGAPEHPPSPPAPPSSPPPTPDHPSTSP